MLKDTNLCLYASVSTIQHWAEIYTILSSSNRKLLQNSGTISHTQALEKAKQEYRKYQEKTIAPVEQAYLDTIHDLEKEAKKQIRNRK